MELADGRYLVEFGHRPDAVGPFSRKELVALAEAIKDWIEEETTW